MFEKKKYFYIQCDTFDVDIFFFINYSLLDILDEVKSKKKYKTLHEYLSEFKNEEASSGMLGRMYPLEQGYAVELKFYKNNNINNLSNMAHEINHLVFYILNDRKIKLTKSSDEVYAYLTGEITKKFLNNFY